MRFFIIILFLVFFSVNLQLANVVFSHKCRGCWHTYCKYVISGFD